MLMEWVKAPFTRVLWPWSKGGRKGEGGGREGGGKGRGKRQGGRRRKERRKEGEAQVRPSTGSLAQLCRKIKMT
jgi:hypothetical protein